MTKPNMMSAFLQGRSKETPDKTTKVAEVAGPATEKLKKVPGRPKKEKKPEVQTTTIRLDPDDHLAVRQLALRDKQTMNELVFVALKEYSARRGIKLNGSNT